VAYLAHSSKRRRRKCVRHVKVIRALWKKEIGACAWTRSETVRGLNGTRGAAAGGEVGVGVEAAEEALMTIEADALETVAGAAGVEYVSSSLSQQVADTMSLSAPRACRDLGPGHHEDTVLLVNPLSAQGALGPVLSALFEGIAPQDGTRGHTRGLVLPHPVDDNAPSPLRRPVNGSPLLVARDVIVVAHLPAGGGIHRTTALGRPVEALATGQVGAGGAPPPHDVEGRAFPDRLLHKVEDAKGAPAIAAVVLAVNLPVIDHARKAITVA
jgi:hypothetical protein